MNELYALNALFAINAFGARKSHIHGTQRIVGVEPRLFECAANCLDAERVRARGALPLAEPAKSLLESLGEKASEEQLTSEEANQHNGFIEQGDIIATLRLKAERQVLGERMG